MGLGSNLLGYVSRNAGRYLSETTQYGSEARQSYDVYLPLKAAKHRDLTVVFLYGGYWRAGSRTMYGYVGEMFARQGYEVLIPDYRLFPAVRHPAFVEDIADAINHYQTQHADNQATQKLVFVAHSSGAQIATLLTYVSKYRRLLDQADRVAGVVTLGGALGFGRTNGVLRDIFPDTDPSTWQPIAAADTFTVPALALGAKHDLTVAPWSTTKFAATIKNHGGHAASHLYFFAQHPTLVLALRRQYLYQNRLKKASLEILDRNCCCPC